MTQSVYSSPEIAKEMKRMYGSETKVVKIKMRNKSQIKKYVLKIEEAHKKAAESTLKFP